MSTPNIEPFGRVLSHIDRAYSYVENASNIVAGLLIFALMCFGGLRILFRVLNSIFPQSTLSIYGFIDIVELAMVGFAVLSIAYVQRLAGHVRMELILTNLKGRWLWFVEAFGTILALFIIGILIPSSYRHFERAFQIGDSTMDLELVNWPAKLVVPVALSLLFGRLFIQTLGYIRMLYRPSFTPVAVPVIQSLEDKARSEATIVEPEHP